MHVIYNVIKKVDYWYATWELAWEREVGYSVYQAVFARRPLPTPPTACRVGKGCQVKWLSYFARLHHAQYTSFPSSSAYSRSISWRVSMWSEVKAMGTIIMFFLPLLASSLITSSVWGPSHGKGPTYSVEQGGEREKIH